MSNTTYSPDGAWRWDGQRWVPNRPSSPPVGASRNGMIVPALVAGGVALIPVLIRLGADTVRAFGDPVTPGEQPWYFDTWFVVVQFLLGVLALALASVAMFRDPGRLSAVAMAIGGGVFLQGFVLLYYRVVVNLMGYGVPL